MKNCAKTVSRRGILFIYGMEWCNPNGDPTFDNEPRIRGERLFVTDVFLKRRIRDYVYYEKGDSEGMKILVREETKKDGSRATMKERIESIIKENKELEDIEKIKEKIIKECWDVRVFGCMAPIPARDKEGKRESEGTSIKLIGPVQATFGISLNSVEKISVGITSVLASEEEKKGGAIGEKHIVPVAIVEQYIFVNDIAAKETCMTENDYEELLNALKNFGAIPTTRTSSKNIWPLLIVEVKFKEKKFSNLLGLLEIVELKENPFYIRDYEIDFNRLKEKLEELIKNDIIENYTIYVKQEYKSLFKNLPEKIENF